MSWLLDTDVICQPAKKRGDPKVIAWLEAEQDRCYTSAVVIAQLAYWVRTKEGRQRQALQAWLTRLVDALHGRIHGFNVSVAHVWAEQERLLEKAGQRMPVEDSYIAATARRHVLTIVTGNDRDFKRPGLEVFNPFKELTLSLAREKTRAAASHCSSSRFLARSDSQHRPTAMITTRKRSTASRGYCPGPSTAPGSTSGQGRPLHSTRRGSPRREDEKRVEREFDSSPQHRRARRARSSN